MKEKLQTAFKKLRVGKNKKTGLILSIVALVEVILLMVVSTSAWVESISSIRIFNTNLTVDSEGNLITNGTKGIIESYLYQKATFGNGDSIDLTEYFRPSGNYHLVGASSVDGKAMYFPNFKEGTGDDAEIQVRDNTSFRLGTINDKNVNYISFTIKTTNSKILGFDAVPTIQFDNTDLSTVTLGDTTGMTEAEVAAKLARLRSLVRLSVGDNSGKFTVFSLNDKMTDDVVDDEHGGLTNDVPIMSFEDYVNGQKVVTTTAGGFLSFNLWIQDPFGEFVDIYKNKSLSITGLKLIPVTKYTAKVSTNNVVQSDATKHGGTVRVGNSDYDVTVDFYSAPGRQVKLYALANATKGFSFKGWSETANGAALTDEDNNSAEPFTYTTKSNVNTIYALFSDERVLYFDPQYQFKSNNTNVKFAAYLWYDNNGTNTEEFYSLTKVASGSPYAGSGNRFVGKYYFAYRGVADKIIFCYMDSTYTNQTGSNFWNKRDLQTYDLKFPSGVGDYMYVATSKQIVKAEGSTINTTNDYANNSSNGNRFILGYWDFYYANVKAAYHPDSTKKSDAEPITDNTITTKLKYSTTQNTTVKYYNTGHSGSGLSYTDYTYIDPLDYTDSTYAGQSYDGTVILKATPSSAYDFNGWYSYDEDSQTYTLEGTATSIEVAPETDGEHKYYAKFTPKPEDWKLWYNTASSGDGSTIQMTASGNVYTASYTLSSYGDIYFKVHDDLRNVWYSDGETYEDYIADTIINAKTVNTNNNNNMHIKGIKGTYNFSYNISTHKLTVTLSNKTLPDVKIWYGASSNANPGNNLTLTQPATNTNTNNLQGTLTLSEGQEIWFKVHDVTKGEWRRNDNSTAGSYDGYVVSTIMNDVATSTSYNDNMYLKGHAGTYTFKYNYQTKKLSLTVAFTNITIELWDDTTNHWLHNDSAVMWYGTDQGWYSMTQDSNENRHFTVSVPSNCCSNPKFQRRVGGDTKNEWKPDDRGFRLGFSAGDNNSGHWY